MKYRILSAAALGIAMAATLAGVRDGATDEPASTLIVQATSVAEARSAVAEVGAVVDRELGIVNAVSAELTDAQIEARLDGNEIIEGEAHVVPERPAIEQQEAVTLDIPLTVEAREKVAVGAATPEETARHEFHASDPFGNA